MVKLYNETDGTIYEKTIYRIVVGERTLMYGTTNESEPVLVKWQHNT